MVEVLYDCNAVYENRNGQLSVPWHLFAPYNCNLLQYYSSKFTHDPQTTDLTHSTHVLQTTRVL